MGDVDFWVGLVESSVWGAIDAGLAGVGFAHRGRFPRIPQGCWEDVEKQVSGFRFQGSGVREQRSGIRKRKRVLRFVQDDKVFGAGAHFWFVC